MFSAAYRSLCGMYGPDSVDTLMVQVVVLQCII
jgi:hypothetical protein